MSESEHRHFEPLLDLQRLVAGIRWRRRTWASLALLGLLAGLAVTVLLPPKPSAVTKLLVIHENDSPSDAMALIETDLQLLQTTRVAQLALDKIGAKDRPEGFVKDYSGIGLSNNILEITVEANTAAAAEARAKALSEVFITDHVRRVEAAAKAEVKSLRDRRDEAADELAKVDGEIEKMTSEQASTEEIGSSEDAEASATELNTLYARRADLAAKVGDLGGRAEEAGGGAPRVAAGTKIIDAPRALPQSVLVAGATNGAVGLGLGLVLGLALAAVSSVVQDRPVLRREIAAHLGASVIAQLPPRDRWPVRLWKRLRHARERRRVAATLSRAAGPAARGGHISVLELGCSKVAGALATDMARELARDGAPVLLVDDLPERHVLRHLKDLAEDAEQVRVLDGADWPDAGAGYRQEYRIGVGSVGPGATWTDLPRLGTEAVLVVKAGHARTEWLHTVARQLADAGIPVIGVVLIRPDPRDRSDGTLWDALQTALRGRAGFAPTPASELRAPAPGALPANGASTAHQEVS